MLEELIKSLDSRGLLVLQILIGKRAIELLEDKPKLLHASNTEPLSISVKS
jgi:hypothetical protein